MYQKNSGISTKDKNAFISPGVTDQYMTAVATDRKIDDDVLEILPEILDSLQELLDSKAYVKRRDFDFYIDNMVQAAESSRAGRWFNEKLSGTLRCIVNGMAARLNRPAWKPVFKSPTGIEVSAEQVEEAGGCYVGNMFAEKGDWIVHGPDMTDLVYEDAEFRLLFTAADPTH